MLFACNGATAQNVPLTVTIAKFDSETAATSVRLEQMEKSQTNDVPRETLGWSSNMLEYGQTEFFNGFLNQGLLFANAASDLSKSAGTLTVLPVVSPEATNEISSFRKDLFGDLASDAENHAIAYLSTIRGIPGAPMAIGFMKDFYDFNRALVDDMAHPSAENDAQVVKSVAAIGIGFTSAGVVALITVALPEIVVVDVIGAIGEAALSTATKYWLMSAYESQRHPIQSPVRPQHPLP